jgi:peptidyl-dipeptidase Dcp
MSPLLAEWSGPYGGVPPWDQVKPELFAAAFQEGIELRRAEIDADRGQPGGADVREHLRPADGRRPPLGRAQRCSAS